MTKINRIKVMNCKSVLDADLQLNGSSVVLTGANNSGKSTILKSIAERIQSKKPELILKKGESSGEATWELTDGCKIIWSFTDKTEKLTYITKENFKISSGVIEQLQSKYFANKKSFDIDNFLVQSSREQQKKLCELIGIDLSEIDLRYKTAYDERTRANANFKSIAARKVTVLPEIQKPDLDALKAEKKVLNENILKEEESVKIKNKQIQSNYNLLNESLRIEVDNFNKEQKNKEEVLKLHNSALNTVNSNEIIFEFFNFTKFNNHLKTLPQPEPSKIFVKLPEPTFLDYPDRSQLNELDYRIESANEKLIEYTKYDQSLIAYQKWIKEGKNARVEAEKCEANVESIEAEKAKLIQEAKMPEGFAFSENGLLYGGFELTKQAQSTSALYIAGLKLATMNLGELKTVHFDASFLDKNSLLEVEKYAQSLDLQLLIERPDFEAGDIQYELINENTL